MDDSTGDFVAKAIAFLACSVFVLGAIAGGCYAVPKYNVWSQGLKGEARLKYAEQSKRILVTQAQAEVDAAKLRALAIAEVGKAAQDYPEYREQEFIGSFAHALEDGKINQIIYVPTERNIPLVEVPHDRTTRAGGDK